MKFSCLNDSEVHSYLHPCQPSCSLCAISFFVSMHLSVICRSAYTTDRCQVWPVITFWLDARCTGTGQQSFDESCQCRRFGVNISVTFDFPMMFFWQGARKTLLFVWASIFVHKCSSAFVSLSEPFPQHHLNCVFLTCFAFAFDLFGQHGASSSFGETLFDQDRVAHCLWELFSILRTHVVNLSGMVCYHISAQCRGCE